MAKATWHTAVYAFDTYSSGSLPYGVYSETVSFKSAAQTRRGLIRAADNAAFWDCALMEHGFFRRLLTVDGNAV